MVCQEVLQSLMLSGGFYVPGRKRKVTYGSTELFRSGWPELRRRIAKRWQERTGMELGHARWTDFEIQECYERRRQWGYKPYKQLESVSKPLPLFNEDDESGILYAYTGCTADVDCRIVKVGYTSKDIKSYLGPKKRLESPKLLATTPGDRHDEDLFHKRWSYRRATGSEHYWPENDLLEFIRDTFDDVMPDFESVAQDVKDEYERWKQSH